MLEIKTAIHSYIAVQRGNLALTELLLDKKANLNIADNDHELPIQAAAYALQHLKSPDYY